MYGVKQYKNEGIVLLCNISTNTGVLFDINIDVSTILIA